MPKKNNLVNKRFERLIVLEFYDTDKHGHRIWKCVCDCGNICYVSGYHLSSGHTRSCGCIRKELHMLPNGEAALNKLLLHYKNNAKKRNLRFELSMDEFIKITKSDCHYCGDEPNREYKEKRNNGGYIYNGIDRVNNSLGYILDNCVPCCEVCNKAKRDLLYSEFIEWLDRIVEFRGRKISNDWIL